jgi:hypothetical protein
MFERLRKNREQRRAEKRRAEFERAADESDPTRAHDDRRARDLPDPLGELNEMTRIGPSVGGPGP